MTPCWGSETSTHEWSSICPPLVTARPGSSLGSRRHLAGWGQSVTTGLTMIDALAAELDRLRAQLGRFPCCHHEVQRRGRQREVSSGRGDHGCGRRVAAASDGCSTASASPRTMIYSHFVSGAAAARLIEEVS